jgi:hypothetical protein
LLHTAPEKQYERSLRLFQLERIYTRQVWMKDVVAALVREDVLEQVSDDEYLARVALTNMYGRQVMYRKETTGSEVHVQLQLYFASPSNLAGCRFVI